MLPPVPAMPMDNTSGGVTIDSGGNSNTTHVGNNNNNISGIGGNGSNNNVNSGNSSGNHLNIALNYIPPEFLSVIDCLVKVILPFLAEVHKSSQSRSTVSETAAVDGPRMNQSRTAVGEPTSTGSPADRTRQSSVGRSDSVDVIDIVSLDPSTLAVTGIADRYARSLLKCLQGYPVYKPHPFSDLSEQYLRNGVNVGDVGYVTWGGNFDFLFNICPSRNGSINPPMLPDSFSLEIHEDVAMRATETLLPKAFFPDPVEKTKSGEYICNGDEGAILELPEGAIEESAPSIFRFEELAARRGVEWYEYAIIKRGRGIKNGELYLITSSTKCSQWGIAVFDRRCDPGQGLKFNTKKKIPFFSKSTLKCSWKGSDAPTTTVGKEDGLNQCVFLRGYKIMIRQDIFDNIKGNNRGPAWRGRGGAGPDPMSRRPAGGGLFTLTTMSTVTKPDEVVLHSDFNSSPIHPSDLINAALLSQNPDAKIALTHDDVWCDLLRDNFPQLNYASLISIARLYTSTVNEYGCVLLKKRVFQISLSLGQPGLGIRTSDSSNVLDESNRSVRGADRTPALQESIQNDRDIRKPIYTPTSTTLRPKYVDHSPSDGDEGSAGISVRSQSPPPPDPHALCQDTWSRNARDHSKLDISTALPERLPQPNTFRSDRESLLNEDMSISKLAPSTLRASEIPTRSPYAAHTFPSHGLEKMEPFVSFSAQFGSSAQDFERVWRPGTRQNVLKCIQDWVDHPNSTERIFWLHGPAGAGKSAIAQTFAQSCGQPKVAATFFFYREDSSRNDGYTLLTTLSFQLAFSIPAIKDHIVQSLHKHPALLTTSIEKQFEYLIARPFRSLTEAASEQPCPLSITSAVNQCQRLAPVIIIDGVDECTDEKLQQRFLKIIGNAVKDPGFPFRFLICSKPETHIEDALNEFRTFTLLTDLAKLDADDDIVEKYLIDGFSRIASNRGLKPTWPGREAIQDIIYKSSGKFIFAVVVIRFVGDEDSDPEDQLKIVLNLKPPERVSPFTMLDELYLEILRRQSHQDFLKTFLALLVGRTALSGTDLHKDDATLMDVFEWELHTKLGRMRSLLKLDPHHIDVHHQSFLDFLNEPSRSGDYYVSNRDGTRKYVKLVVDSIVRHVSSVIKNPN